MNLRTKAAAYGIAGVVLASAAILAGANLGNIAPAASGLLSVMLTDPSTVPKGVTAVYVTYDGLGLHPAGLGEGTWVPMGGHGTLETLGLANFSETISSANVPALNYDQISFEISAASIEYHGVNYSASVNGGRLVTDLPGGVTISPSKVTAVVIDVLPTVLNLGDRVSPRMVMSAGVKAVAIPQSEVSTSMTVLQSKFSLIGHPWSEPLTNVHQGSVTISGIFVSSNAFSFQATNHGSQPVDLKMVVIAPASPTTTAAAATEALSNSFVFYVEPNGTLQILHTDDTVLSESVLGNAGYDLAPGATVHFDFSGAITTVAHAIPISKGTSYYVFVVGQAVSPQAVEAN